MGKAIEGFFHWFLVIFLLLFIVIYCCLLLFIVVYCGLLEMCHFYFFKAEFPDVVVQRWLIVTSVAAWTKLSLGCVSTEFLNRNLQLHHLPKNTRNTTQLARSTQSSEPVVKSWSCNFKCLNPELISTWQACLDFKSLHNNVLSLILNLAQRILNLAHGILSLVQ